MPALAAPAAQMTIGGRTPWLSELHMSAFLQNSTSGAKIDGTTGI